MHVKLFLIRKKYLNKTANGTEHKIQETFKENRAIEYKQTKIEFYIIWAGITAFLVYYSFKKIIF